MHHGNFWNEWGLAVVRAVFFPYLWWLEAEAVEPPDFNIEGEGGATTPKEEATPHPPKPSVTKEDHPTDG